MADADRRLDALAGSLAAAALGLADIDSDTLTALVALVEPRGAA